MQLHLNRYEQEMGFFGKKIEHCLKVQFNVSDEEKEAIEKLALLDAHLIPPWRHNKIDWTLKVEDTLSSSGGVAMSLDLSQVIGWEDKIKVAAKDLNEQVKKYLEEGGGEKEQIIDL